MGDLISPDDFSRYSNADLCIRTFGGFSISKNGEIVQLERTNRTKTMHALQMLICAGESGVTSELMMEALFSDENVANPANNLKVTISHLRKTLRESGLDGCFKIQYRSGGYYLDFLKPVSIDFQEFYNCMHEPSSNREERLKYLLRAESIYTGDFLPHLEDYTWVITLSTKFRESYFNCIEEIAAILTAKEEWMEPTAADCRTGSSQIPSGRMALHLHRLPDQTGADQHGMGSLSSCYSLFERGYGCFFSQPPNACPISSAGRIAAHGKRKPGIGWSAS